MKLAVFGATGKTGRLIVQQALADGHQVTALARDPSRMGATHQRLRVVRGAADQADAIDDALRNADAVVSAMGSGGATLTTFGEKAISAMRRAGVSRIVSLVGASVTEPGDPKSLSRSILQGITRFLAPGKLEDGDTHARQLEATELAYTLVRPPRLTDGPATGRVQHGPSLDLGPTSAISRADLAAFMLQVAVDGLYVRAAPMVASSR